MDYGQTIHNILTNVGGIIDLSQLVINTKTGLIGLINSAITSLESATMFLASGSSTFMFTPLMGFNMIGLSVANSAIASTINEHSNEIEQYVTEHQEYIKQDLVDAGGVIIGIGGIIIGVSIASATGLAITMASAVLQ